MNILGLILAVMLGTTDGGSAPPSFTPLQQQTKYYCKYCGQSYGDVANLITNVCKNHPSGKFGARHELYEGSVKSQYTCKFCGRKYRDLQNLTSNNCQKNPGGNKSHEAAL